jgi:Flp pilus assembly pilin Flp
MFRFLRSTRGQGMVEYILIVVVVVGLVLVGYKSFGGKVKTAFEEGGKKIESESSAAFATT